MVDVSLHECWRALKRVCVSISGCDGGVKLESCHSFAGYYAEGHVDDVSCIIG